MSWNYRVLRYSTGELGLHEVFYDADGNPDGCTMEAVGLVGDDLTEMHRGLDMMRRALHEPILEYEALGKQGAGDDAKRG